jgi:hypothetical protein
MEHDVTQLTNLMETLDELYSSVMKQGLDFGPGRKGGKCVLLKPGAEKVFGLFNLTAVTRVIEERADHERGTFAYRVVCYAHDRASGTLVAEAMGACSSREKRLLNDGDPFSLYNVCLKMAEKRAFVNCALRLGMASERFTQDMEDLSPTADPETVLAIIDHLQHPAFNEHERKRTRAFLMDNPEPERAIEFLDRMKARVAKHEAKKPPASPEESTLVRQDREHVEASEDREVAIVAPPPIPIVSSRRRRNPGKEAVALAYLSAGLAVMPLAAPGSKSEGKEPLVPQWQAFSKELPTQDHILSWWAKWPNANMGCVCGYASGLFVLDVDGEAGESSLLMRELPLTPRVKTGRGHHYYFRMDRALKLKNAKGLLPGLDLRASGGQVVVPPSRHKSGHKYVWEVMPTSLSRAFTEIEIYWDGETVDFAAAPDWLLEEVLA